MTKTPLKIVAVQNNAIDNQVLATIFSRDEFSVDTFSNHHKATEHINVKPAANCLITDLELKDSTGFEFIEAVRNDKHWKDIPILVLAMSIDKEKLLILNKLKINGYIVKPFQPERLFYDVLKLMGLEVVTQKVPVKQSAKNNTG